MTMLIRRKIIDVSLRRKRPKDYSGQTHRTTHRGSACPVIGLVVFLDGKIVLETVTAKNLNRDKGEEIWDYIKDRLSRYGIGTSCRLTMPEEFREDGSERNGGRLRKAVGPLPMVRDYGIACDVKQTLKKDGVRTYRINVRKPNERDFLRRINEEQQTRAANKRRRLRDKEMVELVEVARKVREKLAHERSSSPN